jgi:integrase/recombinase XerC
VRVPHLSPTTLTADEQRLILRATAGNVRDHTIISLALGTGLRLAEIVGLDVGDVFAPGGTPRVRVRIRAAIAKGGRAADVFLPDRLVAKLRRFWRWKRERGENLAPDAPLFCNQSGNRISKRRVQLAWATWQRRAGFDRVYGFHALRHTAVTNVYRASRDLLPGAAVRAARLAVDDDGVHAPVRSGRGREVTKSCVLAARPRGGAPWYRYTSERCTTLTTILPPWA